MKLIGETAGIGRLSDLRAEFSAEIRRNYEYKAKSCSTCETPGICCRDEHFVNVRITRLEARAIRRQIGALEPEVRKQVYDRVERAVRKYELFSPDDAEGKTYSCPLFVKGVGCLVHATAKPLPCIAHACYEEVSDLPPHELLEAYQTRVGELNYRVYGKPSLPVPIPVAILPPQGS